MSENDLNKGVGKPLFVAGLGDVRDQLDRCFLPLGLELDPMFAGRKYVGEVNGRTVTITIALRTRNKYITSDISYRKFTGLWLDISATTPVMSRFMAAQPRGWARRFAAYVQRWRGQQPVENAPNLVENFMAFAHDPAWGEMFLADTAVQSHIILLMNHPTLPPGAAVYLTPGKWMWTTPAMPSDFTPEAAQQWVYALGHLAAAAEQSPPMTAVSPSFLERQNPTVSAFIIASLFLFGIPSLLCVCCTLPALLLVLLNAR